MVFAVWAGRPEKLRGPAREAFVRSWQWGRDHIEEIVRRAADERGFPEPLAREYLTRHIQYRLGPGHLEGLAKFRSLARALPGAGLKLKPSVPVV
jgi:predicted solute-binding protein